MCYKNDDSGFGHALEHDVRCPQSHPLALEFLLMILTDTNLPPGDLLSGAAAWVAVHQNADGTLQNPSEVLTYPHAPWWDEGGQHIPASITANLMKLDTVSETLSGKTRNWVNDNLTIEKIQAEEWLFMLYHPFHYFMQDTEFPDVEKYRQATMQQIITLAEDAPENQAYSYFRFAPTPDSLVAKAAPELTARLLDALENQQQDDGSWVDQHDLASWSPFTTILVLLTLQRYGKLDR
ncbi:MAG: hypothetical protein ACPG7F_10315 [Aggregatilineales bacterium]